VRPSSLMNPRACIQGFETSTRAKQAINSFPSCTTKRLLLQDHNHAHLSTGLSEVDAGNLILQNDAVRHLQVSVVSSQASEPGRHGGASKECFLRWCTVWDQSGEPPEVKPDIQFLSRDNQR
jgi:hypothetical protein